MMNKSEKIICLILGAVLVWYLWNGSGKARERAQEQDKAEKALQVAASNEVIQAAEAAATVVSTNGAVKAAGELAAPATNVVSAAVPAPVAQPVAAETNAVLENAQLRLELSSWGAVVKRATLKGYARDCGEISEANPAVELDFSTAPLGELTGVDGLEPNAVYAIRSQTSNEVVFANDLVERKITLGADYRVTYAEKFASGALRGGAQPAAVSLGCMRMGGQEHDLLSVDSMAADAGKGKPGIVHHGDDDSPLKPYLASSSGGCSGCSGSSSASGMEAFKSIPVSGGQTWIAIKNRFFVTALTGSSAACNGFEALVTRDQGKQSYRPESVSVRAQIAPAAERTSDFFIGPKKQSLLWDLEMKDVMEFGMWRWLCYPVVAVLNFFYGLIPNYGVAIILLTILVRIIFWPLTRKSTIGMKKMQELQPKMKEIQKKFKDNPQRLQQETWALYREAKVNPLSSCLPMLIQIPVFIALFNVLRSCVELRYASFLWIPDLSEPEGLLKEYLPFGGLNILPILMAVTTALQSAFSPSAGDRSQQKMMMVFMPAMMLFMFYSFPSALSLYWFLSNVFSIVQMWLIRRQTAKQKGEVITPEVIDPPQTRQMRRHGRA